ncbi:MAG: CYTH domain-containing protein [Muribaculaceae bacterium]
MAKEIEHKYLAISNEYQTMAKSRQIICQGYLSVDKERTVRVRTIDNRGFVTIKGENQGALRQEFEYEIPVADAKEMLDTLCLKPIIEKCRYIVMFEGEKWEVDEFKGALNGLILAEIELPDVNHKYSIPKFVGKNVTGDPRYYNSVLSTATSLPE